MLHHTKVLLDHAVSLERGGRWQSAIDLCEQVFRRSIEEENVEGLVEAVLRMGHSYRQMGDTDLAGEYLELAEILATLHEDPARVGRALNGLAVLRQQHGDIAGAECMYRRAREFALRGGDELTAASVDMNLGTLSNIRGQLSDALEHYRSGLALYESIGHERGIALVLNNLGMLHTDLNQLDSASEYLERALVVCRNIQDVTAEGIIHVNRTELYIARAELDRARESCDEAFEIVSRLDDRAGQAEVLKFYGVIYREANRPHLAETHLRQAIEIAAKFTYPLQEAEAQRELALVLRAQDRNREALAALNRAHSLFLNLQAQREQAEINGRVAQLETDFLSLVRLWGESIEAKDRYTRGHCQRVADYACRIAERVGITEREMVWFRMGAFLHDVGKTEVPEEILNKPGKLTPEERELMERHTIIGYEMLSSIEFPWDILPMVRSHHERWDGTGYPDRLAGEDIPFTARILRIADIFDALTTTRSYRGTLSPEEALRIMRDDHGSFDPDLFTTFQELFPELRRLVGGSESSWNGDRTGPSSSPN